MPESTTSFQTSETTSPVIREGVEEVRNGRTRRPPKLRVVRSAVEPEEVDDPPMPAEPAIISADFSTTLSPSLEEMKRAVPTVAEYAAEQQATAQEIEARRAADSALRNQQIMAMFGAISRILAARFLLLLALGGAFVLALMAMEAQSVASIGILVSYCLLTVAPLVGLQWGSGKPRG